jgi:tripartite-type tricarboxylate transporter receptor subunit TctC
MALVLSYSDVPAQSFSTRPMTIVVATSVGGGHDFTARQIAQSIALRVGHQVLVDNRPGASGLIGAELVAKSAGDGHTLLLSSPTAIVIGPHLREGLRFDPVRDLAPVTLAGTTPLVLVAHPSVPVRNLDGLIKLVKRSPGKHSYGASSPGSPHHIAGAWLMSLAKLDMTPIPYKGAGPTTIDVLAGQIPFAIVGMAPVLTHIHSGKLTAIAVMTRKRVVWLPQVPTVSETPGLETFEMLHWMGVQVASKTPREIVKRLHKEITDSLSAPEVKKALLAQGIEPVGNSPDEFGAFLQGEYRKYADLVKLSGATLD